MNKYEAQALKMKRIVQLSRDILLSINELDDKEKCSMSHLEAHMASRGYDLKDYELFMYCEILRDKYIDYVARAIPGPKYVELVSPLILTPLGMDFIINTTPRPSGEPKSPPIGF